MAHQPSKLHLKRTAQRNRHRDHFTQEDPIGLAGGMNLYDFAGGDPVNFSDPFGLCPIEKDGIPCAAGYGPGVKVSSAALHAALDAIAAEADMPLLVKVGGATKSSHLVGEAADVIFEGTWTAGIILLRFVLSLVGRCCKGPTKNNW